MKAFDALTCTKPGAKFSWKVLLYAVLCTLFGTACLYCCIYLMFLNGFGVDGGGGEHPYDQAGMTVGLLVSLVLLALSFYLWFCTLSGAPRMGLHTMLSVAVVILGFSPAFLLMDAICGAGEQIGRLILYG